MVQVNKLILKFAFGPKKLPGLFKKQDAGQTVTKLEQQ